MRPSKRNELVEKALDVFYENGFHATGMDMLVERTGISKTSMYKHFRTKEDLILAALRLRDEQFRQWMFQRIGELGTTPRGQLVVIFDALREWFADKSFRGCLFVKAAAEYQEEGDPIYVQSCEHKRLLVNFISDLAEEAGVAAPDILARKFFILIEGAAVMAHLLQGEDPAMDAKAIAKTLLVEALGA